MKLLLKSARIVDPTSEFNSRRMDILLENGVIKEIGEGLKTDKDVEVFESTDLHVSPGLVDMHCYLRDPGDEHKEDLRSAAEAASAGGYTSIIPMPVTNPVIDNKGLVEYIVNKSSSLITNIYPCGAITTGNQGKDIAEMYDMKTAGAIVFSDGKKSIKNSGSLSRALLYAKGIGAPVLHFPEDTSISSDGKMNEGIVSTKLGLKGIPSISEELFIARDLALAAYNETPIHIQGVSTAGSVAMIRTAKVKGQKVTCEVFVNHLFLDDENLVGFDSNYKVKPPFRTKEDIEALKKGLKDGTIDVISTDHTPHDVESKQKEFDQASFGIISFETAFAVALTALKNVLSIEELITKMSINPRKICNLPSAGIENGKQAELTLFDPTLKWTFSAKDIRSKSRNTPYIGTEFTGKALGIVNKGQVRITS